jgi:hypothetical protein
MGRKMDRLSTGIVIALAALMLSGGFVRDVMAEESGMRAPVVAEVVKSQAPVLNGPRSERVLSLLLTLEALRTAPVLLEARKF